MLLACLVVVSSNSALHTQYLTKYSTQTFTGQFYISDLTASLKYTTTTKLFSHRAKYILRVPLSTNFQNP